MTLTAPAAVCARLGAYAGELAGFLMVARAELRPADASRPTEGAIEVAVSRTGFLKCDRCWTYREDARSESAGGTLCGRCRAALEARGAPRS